jgi:uncharacterized protein YxeA
MKKLLIALVIIIVAGYSASAQTSNAEVLAGKIAQKMKDTLSLTETQKGQVYTINMQLYQQKETAWQQYGQSDSLVTVHVQRIENTRDSLYKAVLTAPQYILYRDKKRKLVNNN